MRTFASRIVPGSATASVDVVPAGLLSGIAFGTSALSRAVAGPEPGTKVTGTVVEAPSVLAIASVSVTGAPQVAPGSTRPSSASELSADCPLVRSGHAADPSVMAHRGRPVQGSQDAGAGRGADVLDPLRNAEALAGLDRRVLVTAHGRNRGALAGKDRRDDLDGVRDHQREVLVRLRPRCSALRLPRYSPR